MAVQDNVDNSGDCCDHNHYQIHYLKPATKEQLPRGERREREREQEKEKERGREGRREEDGEGGNGREQSEERERREKGGGGVKDYRHFT